MKEVVPLFVNCAMEITWVIQKVEMGKLMTKFGCVGLEMSDSGT